MKGDRCMHLAVLLLIAVLGDLSLAQNNRRRLRVTTTEAATEQDVSDPPVRRLISARRRAFSRQKDTTEADREQQQQLEEAVIAAAAEEVEEEEEEEVEVEAVSSRRRALPHKVERKEEEEPVQSPVRSRDRVRASRPRLRGRGRAMTAVGGRGAGRRKRPRPRPVYYDYADYYDYDYGYYYDDAYYTDEEVEYAVNDKRTKTKNTDRFTGGGRKEQDEAEEEESSPDYTVIKKLLQTFFKEKEFDGTLSTKTREKEEEYECPPREDVSYYTPDEEQCDKYYECNIKGEIREHLCPDGFTFDITQEKCDYPSKVNCTGRPLLQDPQPSVNCSRANGFFPWPANISCQNFWDCRQGKAFLQTCPVGAIFDPPLLACTTPDQSSRSECTDEGEDNYLGFTCPQFAVDSVLRFGNHDRLPHPSDCNLYFTCLNTGGTRLGTCGRKQVFNNATGNCGEGKDVPGCENYWREKLKEDYDDYYYEYQ